MSVGFNNIYAREHQNRIKFGEEMTLLPNERELDCCVIDGNSALRNSTSALSATTSLPAFAATAIGASAAVGGILGVPIGLLGARDGYKKAKASYSCGDTEGVVHNTLWGVFGAGFGGVSGMLATEGVLSLAGKSIWSSVAAGFGGIGLGMNGTLGLYGAYGLRQAHKFGNELEKRNVNEALEWLNGQVSLSENDVAECYRTADPDGEMAKRLQKKWNELELRVGADCAKMIREKLPEAIVDPKAAEELVEEVKKANFKEQVKYALFILIALVGTAAFIAMLLSTGPASPAIFVLGALLWLTVDSSKLHSYIGEKCWTWHRGDKTPELPCQTALRS